MISSSNLLAVDIGEYGIKALDGRWQNAASFVNNSSDYSRIATEDGVTESEALSFTTRQLLKGFKMKGKDVYTSIPLSEVILREITIGDDIGKVDVEGALEIDLGDALPFSTDQVYFDYVQDKNSKNKYLVAASRRDLIDGKTNNIKNADRNISNLFVDIDAFAYGRLVSQLHADILRSDRAIMLVDVGHKKSKFYIFGSEGLIYNREQQIGGYHITEAISEVYDISFTDAENRKHGRSHDDNFKEIVTMPFAQSFAEQLNLVVDFYQASAKADKQISKVEFVGGGACLKGFLEALSTHINIPISLLDLSPVWKKEVYKDDEWLHFCAQYAQCIALLAEGEDL